MGVSPLGRVAKDYAPGASRLVRQTCLEVATRLGDFRDEVCVVGGLVPSLIIPESELREGEEAHVGTIDLDLGFSLAILDQAMYEEIARRLSEGGFAPDRNEMGNATSQRWKSSSGVTVDFLMPPAHADDTGGRLRNLDKHLAAFIIPGLELAFRDSSLVTVEDHLPTGGKATRQIRVCGPAAFTVLKVLAFGNRGKPKDAYDLYYLLRHHALGAEAIGARIAGWGAHRHIEEAFHVLIRDFRDPQHVGPVRVAQFLGGSNESIQADAAGFVRALLRGACREIAS
jgi:hypothetical protein